LAAEDPHRTVWPNQLAALLLTAARSSDPGVDRLGLGDVPLYQPSTHLTIVSRQRALAPSSHPQQILRNTHYAKRGFGVAAHAGAVQGRGLFDDN